MKDNLKFMRECVRACRNAGIQYVIHPVKYSLLDKETFNDLEEMAALADRALILHDERSTGGNRLEGDHITQFEDALKKLVSMASISIENAAHTGDIQWFWNTYADSVTLDIGHVESFGLDSLEFVGSLDDRSLEKIQFVHMHRNNGLHGGITDHWPLTPDCREVRALKKLIKMKPDISVILEINEVEEIDHNLILLKTIRDEHQNQQSKN
jgi:hypothetical protein